MDTMDRVAKRANPGVFALISFAFLCALASLRQSFYHKKKQGAAGCFTTLMGSWLPGGGNHISGAETPRTLHNWQLFTGMIWRRGLPNTHRLLPGNLPYLQGWTGTAKVGSLSTAKSTFFFTISLKPQSAPFPNSLPPTP